VNYEQIAAELLRCLRGKHSQAAFSRRLSYRSNIVNRWEAQEAFPTAARFLEIVARAQPRRASPLHAFFVRVPAGLAQLPADPRHAVAAFLNELRGKMPVLAVSQAAGFNRYSVARWLNGQAEPKLPQFLCLVEVMSRRVLDFIACCVDPARVPSLAAAWRRLELARATAYRLPWSHAVLRALELEGARAGRQRAWLLERLGISESVLDEALEVLAETGQIVRVRGAWRPRQVVTVNTAQDPERAHALKLSWTETALARMRAGAPGNFGYSLFAVSRSDLRRLREVHLEYVRAMQGIIAESKPTQCVGLYCAQLLDLGGSGNALAEAKRAGLASPAARSRDMAATVDDSTAPESTQTLFQRHVCDGRIERLIELYEPGGVVIQKDGRMLPGIDAIREHLASLLALKPSLRSTVVEKIEVADVAMLFSEWRLSGTSPDGVSFESTGSSFDVVRRQPNGTWRIAIDSPHGTMPRFTS
jgi:ketosteroid isomerase-like protein